ncbi:hypothetical protein BDW66DRAFT_82570 [Aspergillus desertorum]
MIEAGNSVGVGDLGLSGRGSLRATCCLSSEAAISLPAGEPSVLPWIIVNGTLHLGNPPSYRLASRPHSLNQVLPLIATPFLLPGTFLPFMLQPSGPESQGLQQGFDPSDCCTVWAPDKAFHFNRRLELRNRDNISSDVKAEIPYCLPESRGLLPFAGLFHEPPPPHHQTRRTVRVVDRRCRKVYHASSCYGLNNPLAYYNVNGGRATTGYELGAPAWLSHVNILPIMNRRSSSVAEPPRCQRMVQKKQKVKRHMGKVSSSRVASDFRLLQALRGPGV